MIRKDLDSSSLTIPKPDWESYCHKVADLIMSEQTPAKVMEVRGKFYELLSHCIPPTVILKVGQGVICCCIGPLRLFIFGPRAPHPSILV